MITEINTREKYKVVALAYACEPHLGSEPEVGWQWVQQIAKYYEVWVITRKSNKVAIEKELEKTPSPSLHLVYFDYPEWLKFWKKGRRGIHLYYILWQIGTYFKIKDLHKQINFSISHHITFVNSWLPSVLAWLDIPFIWGPIGRQHIPLSIPLLKEFGFRGAVNEVLRNIIYKIAEMNPFVKHTFKKAYRIITINRLILYQNRGYENKIIINPAIAVAGDILDVLQKTQTNKNNIVVMFGGAAIYLKGITLAVKAFTEFSKTNVNAKLVIAGSGPLLEKVENLLNKSGMSDKAIFLGQLSRDTFLRYLSECDIFLYPSFEEEVWLSSKQWHPVNLWYAWI